MTAVLNDPHFQADSFGAISTHLKLKFPAPAAHWLIIPWMLIFVDLVQKVWNFSPKWEKMNSFHFRLGFGKNKNRRKTGLLFKVILKMGTFLRCSAGQNMRTRLSFQKIVQRDPLFGPWRMRENQKKRVFIEHLKSRLIDWLIERSAVWSINWLID